MANKRISALDNLGATPATGDILPITDIDDPTGSPQGTTKGVTFSDLTNHLATTVSLGNHESLTSAVHGISAFGATLVDDADAATARTTLGVDAAGTDNSTDVTLAGTPDYITIVGQTITRNQIDLAVDVTGSLPNTSVSGLGTASTQDVGTADGNVVQLSDVGGTVKLPAVDGSQLTNVSGSDSTKLAIASNLSDLNDAATARTNLGLGTAATTASTDYATASHTHAIDDLSDVDTSTVAPTTNDFLKWGGSNWVPAVPTADVDTPLTTALRGTDNPHIGAFPNQSFKVIDNPRKLVMVIATDSGDLDFLLPDGGSIFLNTPTGGRLAPGFGFSVQEDATEPDIEVASGGENYSVISGDSDTKGANGLPIRQGFNVPDIGANPAPLLISGGSIA